MKSFRYLSMLLILTALTACSKDNKEEEETSASFSLGKTSFVFEPSGGTQELTVSTAGSWSISSTEDWCTVSPAEGIGESTVSVTVGEIPQTSDTRKARLMVTSDGLTLTVNVSQTFDPETFLILPTQVSLSANACDFEITVISHSLAYEITLVDEWIKEVSRIGEPFSGETIRFHAEANASQDGASRNGVVSICTQDGSCIPVMIEQAGQYPRKGLFFRFTATWCGWCPYMDEAFHKAAQNSDQFTFATIHASSGYPLYFQAGQPLVSAYKVSGYPTGVACGWKEMDNNTNTTSLANQLVSTMYDFFNLFPNTAAISITPVLSGNQLQVSAEVTSTVEGTFKISALVLESGIIQSQAYFYYYTNGSSTTVKDFQHDNVARKLLSESILGDSFSVERGGKASFNWSTELDGSWDKDQLTVLVWITADYGDLAAQKAKKNYPDNYIMNAEAVPVQ